MAKECAAKAIAKCCHFVSNGLIFSRGYVKRRKEHCCGAEYANVSLTQL